MDGDSVEAVLGADGIVEGRKMLDNTNVLVWAIIKRFTTSDDYYNRRIDVFIENTQRLIPEYLVNFNFLLKKASEFGLALEETEVYSETFKKFKDGINEDESKQSSLDKSILELDKEEIQKIYNFENRYTIEKILKSRIRNGEKEVLIKWKGWDSDYNSWVLAKSIE